MTPSTKCLWTFLLTTFISLLTEQLCQCSPILENTSDAEIDQGSLAENDDLKRDWSKFNSWGKRGFQDNFAAWGKRDWDSFHSWGKRDQIGLGESEAPVNPLKRKWSKFTSWGKRADLTDEEKREWSAFNSWGKRDGDDMNSEQDKRKWEGMATWGKRDPLDGGAMDTDKRKWSTFTSWGKRSDGEAADADKRKWDTFSVWGKRSDDDMDSLSANKREWSSFTSWGKRRLLNPWQPALGAWGKRRWSGLNTWGKRSADSGQWMSKDVARRLLALFDLNGDGALDVDELTVYIQTLTSHPSRPEMGGAKTAQSLTAKM